MFSPRLSRSLNLYCYMLSPRLSRSHNLYFLLRGLAFSAPHMYLAFASDFHMYHTVLSNCCARIYKPVLRNKLASIKKIKINNNNKKKIIIFRVKVAEASALLGRLMQAVLVVPRAPHHCSSCLLRQRLYHLQNHQTRTIGQVVHLHSRHAGGTY